jgi:hypothetical protein
MNSYGKIIEKEIIEHINKNIYINRMNENMKNFLNSIFDFCLDGVEITANKYGHNYKPDIVITANGISKYISIKSGSQNSIHQEHIYSFIYFLKKLNMNEQEIISLLQFHFNDGTIDGAGNERKNANEFIEKNNDSVLKINEFMNKLEIKKALIERLLFKGEYNMKVVDFIYYGDIDKGYWADKNKITEYLLNKKFFSCSIHVSKLYYQSLHRNLKFDVYSEFKRYYVQFKWYSLKEDIKYIFNK